MLVCVVLSCLFLVALWSPAGKGPTSYVLSLSQMFPGSHKEIRARLAP